jgi:hypothetical protein
MQQFLHIRSALANDLGRIAGVPLAAIHFQEREQQPRRRAAKAPNRNRSKP